jgi:HAD superfamily hydrolase (TIGR01484 family)
MKNLIVFDLDGTLAESKSAIDAEMSALLGRLLAVVRVAVISGGDFPQFAHQLVGNLPAGADFGRLSLLPTCGTRFFEYRSGTWDKLYAEDLTADQKQRIIKAINDAVDALGLRAAQTWGEIIEDRESQITFSALGQQAPLEAKKQWDPDIAKRKLLQARLQPALPDFSVRVGGSTSIDITLPGIDKAYGMRKLRDILGIPIAEMLYIGDALFPGGNDAPVHETGVDAIQVRDPQETKHVIEAIVACVSAPATN